MSLRRPLTLDDFVPFSRVRGLLPTRDEAALKLVLHEVMQPFCKNFRSLGPLAAYDEAGAQAMYILRLAAAERSLAAKPLARLSGRFEKNLDDFGGVKSKGQCVFDESNGAVTIVPSSGFCTLKFIPVADGVEIDADFGTTQEPPWNRRDCYMAVAAQNALLSLLGIDRKSSTVFGPLKVNGLQPQLTLQQLTVARFGIDHSAFDASPEVLDLYGL